MGNETQRVDVLAVFHRMAAQANACRQGGAGAGTQDDEDQAAILAVAELIEAGKEVERTEKAYWNMPLTRNPERYAKAHEDAQARLSAALDRCGGAI